MDHMNFDLSKKILKQKRHDYMNDIQIVYGYLMMNKKEKAIEKIQSIIQKNTIEGQLSKINSPYLYEELNKFILNLFNKGVDIDLYIYNYCMEDKVDLLKCDIENMKKLFNHIIDELIGKISFFIEERDSSFSVKILLDDENQLIKIDEVIKSQDHQFGNILIEDGYILYDTDLE